MENENMEKETPTNPETETPKKEEVAPKDDKELKTVLAQKEHFREKAEKAEAKTKSLEAELNKLIQSKETVAKSLDVEDYIDISASLEGLDQREKEYLAKQHKLTGRSLSEIRKDEDFVFWQNSYRIKVEKEKTLAPSGKQFESPRPKSLSDKLKEASIADKEKMLIEAGLYKSVRPRADRVDIGKRQV